MTAIGNALVIGGGIGGLTAGVALRQAGIATDLVEVQPRFNVYGVGIIQPNNTLRALDRIGLARACVELGTPFPGWRLHAADGTRLMDAPNGTDAAPGFPANNGIPRPMLHRVLSEAAYAHDVAIRLGTSARALRDEGGTVAVDFSDGSTGRYDLVVASDGLYSKTRAMLFGDEVRPHHAGQAVWRYNLPRPPRVEWGEIHLGARTKVGLTPIGPDLMYMFLVSAEADGDWKPADRLAALMRERLDGFGPFITGLREQIVDNDGVVYRPAENLLLPAPWYKGRVLVIGDAAHATTPHLAQGAAMAIEDAVLLGQLLRQDRPVDDLLAEFMARRFKRARYVVESSERIARWELESWQGIQGSEARSGELLHEASVALLEDF